MTLRLSRPLSLALALAFAAVSPTAPAAPQAQSGEPAVASARPLYWSAHDALGDGDLDLALQRFRSLEDELRRSGHDGADSALYWQAYTLQLARRSSEADRTVDRLLREHPDSRWVNEARALRSGAGTAAMPGLAALSALGADRVVDRSGDAMQAAEPADQAALDAIDALLASSSTRAAETLTRVLDSRHSDQVKTRALFVLVQLDSAAAERRITTILQGDGSSHLKREAIKMIAFGGARDALDRLASVYAQQTDPMLRKAVMEAWMIGGRGDLLAGLAREEKDPRLQREAVSLLGALGDGAALDTVLRTTTDPALRLEALRALGVAGDFERLAPFATDDADPAMRRAALEGLGIIGGKRGEEALAEAYRSSSDVETRRAAINGFIIAGRATAAIDLYRTETDPDLKRELLRAITVIDDDAALDLIDRALQR